MFDYKKLVRSCERKLIAEVDQHGSAIMKAPLLSVFIGPDACANRTGVEDVFNACWEGAANTLQYLEGPQYSSQTALESINRMLGMRDQFAARRHEASMAVFFDMDDPEFDDDFAKLCDLPQVMSIVSVSMVVFANFRFGAHDSVRQPGDVYSERLDALLGWAREAQQTSPNYAIRVICLSDVTDSGFLDETERKDNYRIGCDVMVVLNSVTQAGKHLGGALQQVLLENPCCSVLYRSTGKNNAAIVATVLDKLVEGLQAHSRALSSDTRLANRIDPDDPQRFSGFLGEHYRRIASGLAQSAYSALPFLPYTQAVEELDASFQPKKVLFAKVPKKIAPTERCRLTDEALLSLTGHEDDPDFMELFCQRYCDGEARLGRHGVEASNLRHEFKQMLARSFSYVEMREWFKEKADELASGSANRRASDIDAPYLLADDPEAPQRIAVCADYTECLAVGIELTCRHEAVSGYMTDCLVQALRELGDAAQAFADEVERFGLRDRDRIPTAIKKAYGSYAAELIDRHADELFASFVPVGGEGFADLLESLYDTLLRLDALSGERVFTQSIRDDIAFINRNSPELGTESVIASCFRADQLSAARMTLLGGYSVSRGASYRLVGIGEAFPGMVEEGEVVSAPWSDRFEQLTVYPIDTRQIVWK